MGGLIALVVLCVVAVPLWLIGLSGRAGRLESLLLQTRKELEELRQEVRALRASPGEAASASPISPDQPSVRPQDQENQPVQPVQPDRPVQPSVALTAEEIRHMAQAREREEEPPAAPPAAEEFVLSDGAGTSEDAPASAQAAQAAQDAAAPPAADRPARPAFGAGAAALVWGWFKANPLLYSGLCVFLVGVSFALAYLAKRGLFSLEARFALIGLAGLAMTLTGWRLRGRNAQYGLSLMGGGSAVLYLVLFMSARVHLLPATGALVAMVALVFAVSLLALAADAEILAVLSSLGGFMAPVLLSTGGGNHIALFGYFSLLTLGNAALLRYRTWDIPALLNFVAVFGLGGLWGYTRYEPGMLVSMELFLLFFFVAFTFMQWQLARHADELDADANADADGDNQDAAPQQDAGPSHGRPGSLTAAALRSPAARRYMHSSLLFGLPLAAFVCQYRLVQPYAYMPAVSALALAAWHVGLGWLLRDRRGAALTLTRDVLLIIGLGFSILCVPLCLDAKWSGCFWAVQGVGMVWLGLRQHRLAVRILGCLLQLCAACAHFASLGYFAGLGRFAWLLPAQPNASPLVSSLLITLCAVALLELFRRHQDALTPQERRLVIPLQCWAMLWWIGTCLSELGLRFETSCLWAVQGVVMVWLGLRYGRLSARIMGFVLQLLAACAYMAASGHVADLGYFAGRGHFGGLVPSASPLAGGLLMTLCAAVLLELFRRCRRREDTLSLHEQRLDIPLQLWGMAWWLATGMRELGPRFETPVWNDATLIFLALSCMAWMWAGARLKHIALAASGHLLLPVLLLFQPRPLARFLSALLAWPERLFLVMDWPAVPHAAVSLAALGLIYAAACFHFWRFRPFQSGPPAGLTVWSAPYAVYRRVELNGFFLAACALATYEASGWAGNVLRDIAVSAWIYPLLAAWAAAWLCALSFPFPLRFARGRRVRDALAGLRAWSGLVLSLWMLAWFVRWCSLPGYADPLPHIPLLAPVDMAQALCLLSALIWLRAARGLEWPPLRLSRWLYWGFGACAFVFLTVVTARAVARYTFGVFFWPVLRASPVFQCAISLLWGLIALGMILAAGRGFKSRTLWLAGAGLLAVTLCKLLIYDLADRQTVYRIVSFLALGLLMLVIGWFCPLPPPKNRPASSPSEAEHEKAESEKEEHVENDALSS